MKDRDPRTIPIDQLIVGKIYKGRGRNFDIGEWDGTGFWGLRNKMGQIFRDKELHWDADDRFGTFQPYEEVE